MAKKSKTKSVSRGKRLLEWGDMRPALLVAHVRTGGTFLAHCLSNHPDIFCPRSEPIAGQHSPWYRHFNQADALAVLRVIWEQPGYQVNLCRVTARQLNQKILRECSDRRVKVLHLTRQDIVATAVSDVVNRYVWLKKLPDYATHTFKHLPTPGITLNPETVVVRAKKMLKEYAGIEAALKQFHLEILPLTYADIVGGEGEEAETLAEPAATRICEFLGVAPMPLTAAGLRKVNYRPLNRTVKNWKDVKRACEEAGLL